MARHERRGNNGSAFETIAGVIANVCSAIPRIAQSLDTLGSVSSFRAWSRSKGRHPIYFNRNAMWSKSVLSLLRGEEDVSILEFGVAYGDATRWWLERLNSKSLRYYGFDLFTGLPRAWRNMPAHAFDAGGKPPEIEDDRITWIKGNVEDTIRIFDFGPCVGRKLIIFDLDIFEPSLVVWKVLENQLRVGDLLYFDEAFDRDERVLLDAYLLPTNRFEVIASSPMGIVLQLTQ